MTQDWTKLAGDLERLLKLRTIAFGMKLFENREEAELTLLLGRFRRRPLGECLGPSWRIGLALFATSAWSWVVLSGK
jgi:hypothetical protein